MTPGEFRQKDLDRQVGENEKRAMDRARFGSPFSDFLFDLVADAGRAQAEQISEEESARRRRAAEADELRTEGRVHVNTRPQRHE